MPTFIYIIGQKTLSGCPYLNTLTARKLLITRGKSKPARLYRTHTCKHFHLDIITSTEIKSLWRARALSIGLRGGGLKQLLPVMSPCIWSSLLLCFALLPLSCQPKDLLPALPSTSLCPNFIYFLFFLTTLCQRPNALCRPPSPPPF